MARMEGARTCGFSNDARGVAVQHPMVAALGALTSRAEEIGGSSGRGGEQRGESAFCLGLEGAGDKASLHGAHGWRAKLWAAGSETRSG
jgi:hypothetical protein